MSVAPAAIAPLPHDRAGSGPPLILLHGALVDRAFWRERLPALAAGREVIAIDLPGHGAAPSPAGPASVAAMAEAVLATLDALDLPSVAVLGHSLGGMVAQELALLAPGRIAALVLADTWCRPRGYLFDPVLFPTVYLHWTVRLFPVATMVELMAAGLALRTPAVAPYVRQVMGRYVGDRDSYLQIWDAATNWDGDARIGAIDCPTLVVAADGYPFTSFQACRMAAAIPGARLSFLPGTGHWVSWDNPAAFDAAVTGFLAAAGR